MSETGQIQKPIGGVSADSGPGSMRRAERPAKPKKSKRKKLYELHTWVGFHLAVIMSLVLFTGTFATISQELDWLANPAIRVTPDGDRVSMQAMVEAVQEAEPDSTITGISPGEGDHFAYRVQVMKPDGVIKSKLVDQWTGKIAGEAGFFDIKYFFRQLHRYLFLPAPIGLTIVTSMAIVLSISLYTGLKTSRNWRTLMTRIRFAKGARTAIGDAHKAAGLWSIWFFALMITTGLWYYAEFLGSDFEPRYPGYSEERAAQFGEVIVDPKIPEIVQAAKSAYPDLEIQSVTFGAIGGRNATMVSGTVGNPIVRERANRVFLDPVSLDVIHVARDRDLGWVQWLNQIADPLHFGNFGGLPLKLIWFTFGLFMTGLSISGVWLTWRRLKSRGASRMQLCMLPILVLAGVSGSLTYVGLNLPIQSGMGLIAPAWFVVGLWLGGLALIGLWLFIKRLRRSDRRRFSVLNVVYAALILSAGASAVHATVLQRPFALQTERAFGAQQIGPVEAALFLATENTGAFTGAVRMTLGGVGGRLNAKSVSLRLISDQSASEEPAYSVVRPIRTKTHVQPFYFQLNRGELSETSALEARIEMESGAEYVMEWPLDSELRHDR